MTTILLVDDHPIVRDGYKRLFERQPGYRVVAEADDAASAYRAYQKNNPDIVIMDFSMPGAGGLEALRHIRQWDRAARVLVLTMHSNAGFAMKAFEAGASGYATKSSEPSELLDLVARLLRGERVLSADIARELALDGDSGARLMLDDLGTREIEILRMVASGLTSNEIAEVLNLSPKTIQNYHYAIKGKTGARTDAELVWLAIRSGLVSADEPARAGR